MRQNLEPMAGPAAPDLERAVRDTLAVYYFPGMWDWSRDVTRPLVAKGLERALAGQREHSAAGAAAGTWQHQAEACRSLLDRYLAWAPGVDRFAPVLVEPDYEVTVPNPQRPSFALVTEAGEAVRYRGRIDLLAVDEHDAYWIVRHRLAGTAWLTADDLADDEEAVTACWAWEQFYLGMSIAGTVCNELRLDEPGGGAERGGSQRGGLLRTMLPGLRSERRQRLVRQHEPSGGGRSVPQHRRMYARAREPDRPDRIRQESGPGFRRTWVRRSPEEVQQAGCRLAADVAAMLDRGVAVDPSPSEGNCAPCPHRAPCVAMSAGHDPAPLLRSAFRERPDEDPQEGRLGGGAWGTGRGAAPPRFHG
jgi:hypothetical protein